jgi:hypothetical protein
MLTSVRRASTTFVSPPSCNGAIQSQGSTAVVEVQVRLPGGQADMGPRAVVPAADRQNRQQQPASIARTVSRAHRLLCRAALLT